MEESKDLDKAGARGWGWDEGLAKYWSSEVLRYENDGEESMKLTATSVRHVVGDEKYIWGEKPTNFAAVEQTLENWA